MPSRPPKKFQNFETNFRQNREFFGFFVFFGCGGAIFGTSCVDGGNRVMSSTVAFLLAACEISQTRVYRASTAAWAPCSCKNCANDLPRGSLAVFGPFLTLWKPLWRRNGCGSGNRQPRARQPGWRDRGAPKKTFN